jgi:hypothetical protein
MVFLWWCDRATKQRESAMRRLVLILLLLASTAWAGPMDDAAAANARGDYAAELRIVRPLAAKGEAWAQSNLGFMYATGQGVVQDYVCAHMRFSVGAEAGNANAMKNRAVAAKQMTPQKIGEAQKLARECQARKFKGCD